MELECYKTLWGHTGSFAWACQQALSAGFTGVEGPAPESGRERREWRQLLDSTGLRYIAEICTAGSYVPDRDATVNDHLASLERKLAWSLSLSPRRINCLGGCDAWGEGQSLEFFSRAIELARQYEAEVCFETHRGRSLFNPWTTLRLCEQLEDLKLTADFSHWCVVCERLVDTETAVLDSLADRVLHIHARIGYDQGPQVPDPRLAYYRQALDSHRRWWRQVWEHQYRQGLSYTTLTPEFGPDGYQQRYAATGKPVGNLWEINQWMAEDQRQQFRQWYETSIESGEVA